MSAALQTGADARAMRTTKWPEEFSKKVNISKVNLPVIKKWVSDEITRILNSDDDVVTEMIFTFLEAGKFPNIKQIQTDISGFLDKDAAPFCRQLWKLLLSAQSDPKGIPQELLEAKKFELIQERLAEDKAREEARQREIEERERERELARVRERERGQRGRGGRGGRDRQRDRSYERRPSRDSRSPPPRRHSPPRAAVTDRYVPGGRGRVHRGRDDSTRRRRRSPSYGRSRSRSRSPPRRRRRDTSSDASRSPAPKKKQRRAASSDEEEDGRHRKRSLSPRRRRRSPSSSDDDSRSPPNRRSPPRRRSRPMSPASSKRKGRLSPPADLISDKNRSRNNPRLSREGSSHSDNSETRDVKKERPHGPPSRLAISKEALQARLASAKLEAKRRRDSLNSIC